MAPGEIDDQLHSSDALVAALYTDLKRLAHRERGRMGAPATLQTTALIHETYLKLRGAGHWNDQQHFLRAAACAMRQVLVDAARARLSQKRGGNEIVIPLELAEEPGTVPDETVLQIDEALAKLARRDARLAQVVECRFFAGYDDEQTAEALEVTSRTVRRDWVKAKAWLHRELNAA